MHQRQHYELIAARRADTDQNYRRFFAITDLAGLRVEDAAVHEATHREILRWVRELGVAGLRVDDPDGLADPGVYLDRLVASAPEVWVSVEKILQVDEELPASWPVAGTTGYDTLGQINALLVDPQAEPGIDRIYRELTGDQADWSEHAASGKRHVATTILQAEFRRLAQLVPAVPDAVVALTELAVAFPAYRSYLPEGAAHLAHAVDTVALPAAGAEDLHRAVAAPVVRSVRRGMRTLPAADWRGDGEGGGGHCLLPLYAVHRTERGGG